MNYDEQRAAVRAAKLKDSYGGDAAAAATQAWTLAGVARPGRDRLTWELAAKRLQREVRAAEVAAKAIEAARGGEPDEASAEQPTKEPAAAS